MFIYITVVIQADIVQNKLNIDFCVSRIIELNGGQPPLTYKRFQTLISRMDPLEMPVETITADIMSKCTTPVSDDHDEKYGVPSLEELGIPRHLLIISCKLCKWFLVFSDSLFVVLYQLLVESSCIYSYYKETKCCCFLGAWCNRILQYKCSKPKIYLPEKLCYHYEKETSSA